MFPLEEYAEHADKWLQWVYQAWCLEVGVVPIKPEFSALVGKAHTYRVMRDLVKDYLECSIPTELVAAKARTALFEFAEAMKIFWEKQEAA